MKLDAMEFNQGIWIGIALGLGPQSQVYRAPNPGRGPEGPETGPRGTHKNPQMSESLKSKSDSDSHTSLLSAFAGLYVRERISGLP